MCTYCDVTPNIILNEAKYSWSQQLCILRIRSGWSYPAFDVANSPNICTKPSQASRNNGVSTPSSDIGTSANDYIDRPVGQFYCKWCLIPARRAGCRTLAVSKWGAIIESGVGGCLEKTVGKVSCEITYVGFRDECLRPCCRGKLRSKLRSPPRAKICVFEAESQVEFSAMPEKNL